MKNYALLGEKLSHSYSPIIHKKIFEEYNINANYTLLECSKDELKDIINSLRIGKYDGFNVTIPYKIEVMKYLDEISAEALAIGSVNTIAYKNGKIIGYNTDYYGFYNELEYYNIPIKNKNCFILGTGGASLALYKALVDLGGNVKYVSRNKKEGNIITYNDLENENIDLLVNATPVGMYPNVGLSPVDSSVAKRSKYVVDIIFNPKRTKLLIDSNSNFNGLLMLVGQAVKAEEIWNDKKYPGDISLLLKEIEAIVWII